MAGEHARHIGMRERDGRNAEILRSGQYGPCQMIRIASFDNIRREPVQQFSPAVGKQGHAIATTVRNTWALHFKNTASHFGIARAGHDQTMPHAGLLTEMTMLREEITLHAAAVRCEKQSNVGNVHSRSRAMCGVEPGDGRNYARTV